MMIGRDFNDNRSRFSWWQVDIFMIKSQEFIMNVRDFLKTVDDRLRFYYECWDFLDGRSVFSCWQVRIFMMIGLDFNDSRSKFSWWQAENFMITGRDFHDDKSRFFWWQLEIYFCSWCYSRKQGRGVSLRFHFLSFGENQDI